MKENILQTNSQRNRERPLGVWLLTIYAVIFAGIFPLVAAVFLLMSGDTWDTFGINALSLIFSIILNVSIIVFAVGTWQGKNRARKALLVSITLYYVLVGMNNLLLVNSGQVPADQQARSWGRALRGMLYPAIYIWYFTQATTKDFFFNSSMQTEDATDAASLHP